MGEATDDFLLEWNVLMFVIIFGSLLVGVQSFEPWEYFSESDIVWEAVVASKELKVWDVGNFSIGFEYA